MTRPIVTTLLLALTLTIGLLACGEDTLRPLDPCSIRGRSFHAIVPPANNLDLLFVIDNSGSMREEQASLAMQIPRLMRILTTGGGEGIPSFPPFDALQVGVVSSDMGTGGHPVAGCSEPNVGDDGILRSTTGCGPERDPRYLRFRPHDDGNAAALGTNTACLMNIGTSGCGFEQPLDAVLKAVTRGVSDIAFVNGTRGHAGGENSDFLRDGSFLAIVMLTGEDDCSAWNPDLFDQASTQFPGEDLDLRCYQYGGPEFQAVHPVERYIDGLLTVHPPHRLFFGAIVGVPTDLVAAPGEADDYAQMLDDPRMQERPAFDVPGLIPSCQVIGRGNAYPPRRIVQVAEGLEQRGASTSIQSICQQDFETVVDAMLWRIATALNNTCLPRALDTDAEGRVPCDLIEVLPMVGDITRCDQLAAQGRVFRERDASGAETCAICQTDEDGHIIDPNTDCQALGDGFGWYYESDDRRLEDCPLDRPQRISYWPGAEPTVGATLLLECMQTRPPGGDQVGLGTDCEVDASLCDDADRSVYPPGLLCDVQSHTCRMACTSTDFCGARTVLHCVSAPPAATSDTQVKT